MARAWEKRIVEKAAELTAPTAAVLVEEVEITQEIDADAAELESLGMELAKVARDKGKRKETLDKIEKLLEGLSDADMRAMVDHPVVAKFLDFRAKEMPKQSDPPGTIYFFRGIPWSKKPWTEADLRGSDIPVVKFTLDEPTFVQWNGLRRSYDADVEYSDYACFYDQIRLSRRERRFANDHAAFLFEGRPATHRDMMDAASMRVRATATGGGERVVGASLDVIAIVEDEGETAS